jgi:hypothetical protein
MPEPHDLRRRACSSSNAFSSANTRTWSQSGPVGTLTPGNGNDRVVSAARAVVYFAISLGRWTRVQGTLGAVSVAYTITLFVRTSEPVAQRAGEYLVSQVVQRNQGVTATATGDGVGWASFELVTDHDLRSQVSVFERDLIDTELPIWPLSMTLTTRTDSVKDQIAWGWKEVALRHSTTATDSLN